MHLVVVLLHSESTEIGIFITNSLTQKNEIMRRNDAIRRNDDDDYYGYDDGGYSRRELDEMTWDAMTDGQYGDMPEGFDGDYDWLGF